MEIITFCCYVVLINTFGILIAIGTGKLIIGYLDKRGYLLKEE